jgi:hypothetical protein
MRFALHLGWAAAPDRPKLSTCYELHCQTSPDASPQAINEPTKY